MHAGVAGPKCEICEKRFESKTALTTHFNSQHERKNDRFRCKFCPFHSYYNEAVWQHEKKCSEKTVEK